MFFNLAWRNAKRSRGERVIYFLTLVVATAAFYIVLSLGKQDVIRFLGDIEHNAVSKLLTTILPMIYICALLFVFSLVVFADKYQLECRSREFGLYLLFGMKKERLFYQLVIEGMMTSILALCSGMILGGFLSEIISLTTARLIGEGVIAHQSSISLYAIIWTAVGFLAIQALALFVLGGKLFQKEIHQLLNGEMEKKQDMGSIRDGALSFILGIVFLLVAYWIVLKQFMTAGGILLIVAVGFGIIGTLLFIKGLARLVSLLAGMRKDKATRGLYTFTLRQFQENIAHKYVSVSVASILMMLTIMCIANGSATIMSYSENLVRESSVYDFTVTGDDTIAKRYLTSEEMKPYVADLNRMELGTIKHPDDHNDYSSYLNWSALRKEAVKKLSSDEIDPALQEAANYEMGSHVSPAMNLIAFLDTGGSTPYLVSASAYNRLLEAAGQPSLKLADNEAVFYLNPDLLPEVQAVQTLLNTIIEGSDGILLQVDGTPIQLKPNVVMKGLTADKNIKVFSAVIVTDQVYEKYVNPDTEMTYWSFCIPKPLADKEGLLHSIMNANELLLPSGLYYESYLNNFGRQLFYIISGSYTTLYMGFMFLVIACALLALQFLTQFQATKKRYITLSMLGTRREQMKKSMHRQILYYFLLPLSLACISGSVGLWAMQANLYLMVSDHGKVSVLMVVMVMVVLMILVLYAIAVARTADKEINKLDWTASQ